MQALLGLGANLGDGATTLRAAAAALAALPASRLLAASSLWRSAPLDAGGPDYWNAVLELDTDLDPTALLLQTQAIELRFGRQRPAGVHNAPRTLDIDLLCCDALRMQTPQLTLPHPRWHTRAFVLAPLLELHPSGLAGLGDGVALAQRLAQLQSQGQRLQRLGPLLPD